MDNKMIELIAIGASITANCKPCLQYHDKKAREYGAKDVEIKKAIEVGQMVRKGSSSQMDDFIRNFNSLPSDTNKEAKGCGCT